MCQVNKGEIVKALGLLQPLHIPNQIWEAIPMDFITGLPKSEGKDVIFFLVSRLTKYAHVCETQSTYTVGQVEEVFMKEIIRLDGFPKVIVSDRDAKFK